MNQKELLNEIKQALKHGAIYRTDGCIKLSYDGKKYTITPTQSGVSVTINDFCEQDMDSKRKPVINKTEYKPHVKE